MPLPERRFLLLLNGPVADLSLVKRLARRAQAVMCADGGAKTAARLKVKPRFVVGDMDSLPSPLPYWKGTVYWCDFDEDRSDFEKALEFCSDIGWRRLWVAGALGGRLDHALVNLALIERYSAAVDIELVDSGTARLLGKGKHRFPLPSGSLFSLLALGEASVTLTGARYPLEKTILKPGSRGLSNRAEGPVAVTVHSGRVWFIAP